MAAILSEFLLQIVVCPVCHEPLAAGPDQATHAWLHCAVCGRYYPVEDGIAVLLAQRATLAPSLP